MTKKVMLGSELTLNAIDGDYGLISLDVDCLQSILYARLHNIPLKITTCNTLTTCILKGIPSFKGHHLSVGKFSELSQFIETAPHKDTATPSDVLALTNFIRTKLRPIYEFVVWDDTRNTEEFSNLWYMKVLPFPYNFAYTRQRRSSARGLLQSIYPFDDENDVVTAQLLKESVVADAKECLTVLSQRLGQERYFLGGEKASVIDVLVYSYLAPFLKIPFPSNEVPLLLTLWPNLVNLIKRIDKEFFRDVKVERKYLKNSQLTEKQQNEDDISYMAIAILFLTASPLLLNFASKFAK